MRKNKRIWLIVVLLGIVVFFGIREAFNQPSIEDLPGDFTETAFVRNEQNKGGIIRIYAVSVGDMQHADYEACADLFPTNDYGSVTKIYFFDKKKGYPEELSIEAPHYDTDRYEAIMILRRTGNEK